MIGHLPKTLNVARKEYKIRADYRDCLTIFAAMQDKELNGFEKTQVMLQILYEDFESIPPESYEEACKKALWFLGYGSDCKQANAEATIIDWKKDQKYYFSAVNAIAGKEVRDDLYIHFWTFLGYFLEIGDCSYANIINIRRKIQDGKKLDAHEKKFYESNKELIDLEQDEKSVPSWLDKYR